MSIAGAIASTLARKDPLVQKWIEEIKLGEEYRKKYSQKDKFDTYRKMYRGDWSKDILPVNRTFSYGRSMIPRTIFNAPRVCVTATRPEMVPHALVVEAVTNWLIRETKIKKTLKTAALHAYYAGVGPIKLGYDSEFGYLPDQAVDKDSGTVTQVSRKSGDLIEYNTNVKPGMPWGLPMLPDDLVTPWGYKDPDALPWVAHRILRPLADVQADQKYAARAKDLKGTKQIELAGRRSVFSRDSERPFVEMYEIRDLKTHEIIVMAENTIILQERDILQVEGLPYEFLIFNEDPEYFWGIPDVKILEPQQLELNEVRTQESAHRKIALIKFLAQKGAFSPGERERFLSGDVGAWVETAEGVEVISNAIMTLQPHIPPDLRVAAQSCIEDMRESMRFSENQVGTYARKQNTTATEAGIVQGGFAEGMDDRKDIMSDCLAGIVKKWHQYIFTLWDKTKVIPIVGPRGEQYWIEYTGQELKGEYYLRIDPESGVPISSNLRRQLADGLLKTYGGDQLMDQVGLRQHHLAQYEDVAPGISALVQSPVGTPEQMAAGIRQPNPAFGAGGSGGSGNPPGTNQGGGTPIPGPNSVVPFEKFKEQMGRK
jgi:hypothetical protein